MIILSCIAQAETIIMRGSGDEGFGVGIEMKYIKYSRSPRGSVKQQAKVRGTCPCDFL